MPELGLVCITHAETVRFRHLTRTRLLSLDPTRQLEVLRELYRDNLDRLETAFRYCHEHRIRLYRVHCGLLPFADHPVGEPLFEELLPRLAELGKLAEGLRLVMHPDQFCVLNSDNPETIANSVRFLEVQAAILDGLGQPRSPWATLMLHGGKGDRAARMRETVATLSPGIRTRLCLENDEKCYSSEEILAVCRDCALPMVFDAHHHVVHEKLDSYEHPSVAHYLAEARTTWPDPAWQLVHISNGRSHFNDQAHHDLIEAMPSCYHQAPWIEVEAKHKEVAIAKLRAEWK